MYFRHQIGKDAENDAAHWFLSHREARLIGKNFRCKVGELDLIFEELLPTGKQELVFVEVRARAAEGMVDGPQSVDFKKQQRLKKTVDYFLLRYSGKAQSLRMDLLSWNGTEWSHLENIWLAGP
jgi:putative endonuclease